MGHMNRNGLHGGDAGVGHAGHGHAGHDVGVGHDVGDTGHDVGVGHA